MNFLCFDTEDDSKELMQAGKSGFLKRVTQIAAITAEGKKYYNKGNIPDFIKWLQRQPEQFIYAHNLQYDIGNLFAGCIDCLDITLVGGRLIKAVWGNKVFLDSFNIWPMSAKKLGNAFGLKKLETESMATDKEYVFRDVEIIRQAMLFVWSMCASMEIKNCPPTLGGLAVKLWKAWGGKNYHDSTKISREALYGGRVELFKVRNDSNNIAWTDINSLYPYVMLGDFPGLCEPCDKLPDYGVADVTISQPETDIATLPYRDTEGRILYPWGKFRGTWTIPEIRQAEQFGAKIEKLHEAYGTSESIRPYGEYVTRLYKARLASNSPAEKLFFKLLMNNLYGRLGTTGNINRSVYQTPDNKDKGTPYGKKVLVNYLMPLSQETNWLHAAYVTAYGRLELLKYLRLVGTEQMIYCDTDSVIFDCPIMPDIQTGALPFAIGTELGQMKLEGMERLCLTYAPKMYKTESVAKAKGVPQRLAKQFIDSGKAQFDLPFKLRESIAFFDRQNSKQLSVWRSVTKYARTSYDKKTLRNNRYFPCKISAE